MGKNKLVSVKVRVNHFSNLIIFKNNNVDKVILCHLKSKYF